MEHYTIRRIRLQVRHEYIARPGAHEWPYWINALPYHLQFVSDRLRPAGIPGPEKSFPKFEAVVIDGELPDDPRDLDVADMNADGRPDVVLARSTVVCWYENMGWRRHAVTGPAIRDIVSVAAEDVDRDGRPDLAVACGDTASTDHGPGRVCWLRGNPQEPWGAFPVGGAGDLRCVRWADVDGDGRRELVGVQPVAGAAGATRLVAMHVPGRPQDGIWKTDLISDSLHLRGAIVPLRFFAAPSEQLLACGLGGIHVLNRDPIDGKWVGRQLGCGSPKSGADRGTREAAMGRLREGQRFLAALEGSRGSEVVVYLEPPYSDQPWQRLVIDRTSGEAHGIACADLDSNGDDEIVAGFSGPGEGEFDIGVKAYQAASDSVTRWETHWLEKGAIAVTALRVADLNADKRPDILAAGSTTRNLKVFLTSP